MTDYYNESRYLEAVLFLFYKEGRILIEHRPKREGKEIFIPNGRVDTKDLNIEGDYLVNAMNREVLEEFSDKVTITKTKNLGIFIVEEIKIKFFGFLVTEWEGTVPDFTVEEGKKFADLEWVPILDYKNYLKLPSAVFFVNKAIGILGLRDNKAKDSFGSPKAIRRDERHE